uniref:Carboxylesterase type B domain-containing protein n=1 Tax=Castor canadensis TaxID=51338 RepID=A0A8C0WY75_CASCN
MVWIHGGGLVVGGASTYDGLAFTAHENVVMVTIQYCLAQGMDTAGKLGNWGHLDQVATLHWAQDNTFNFGGNPGSMTIFGESHQFSSPIPCQVLSPLAKNLFHRTISENGVVLTPSLFGKNVRPLAEHIAITAGCKTTMLVVMVHCLCQKTDQELLETTLQLVGVLILMAQTLRKYPFLSTVMDRVLLPKIPEEILTGKNFNTVPLHHGNQQARVWLDDSNGEDIQDSWTDKISEELTPVATEKYLEGADDPVKKKDLFLDLMADVAVGVPSVILSRGHRDAEAPTYKYEFQYHPSFSSYMKPVTVIGDHGDEPFSVFGAPFLKDGASEEEMSLSKMVMKFWVNFEPNGEGLPHWPEYDQKEGYLEIGINTQAAQRLKDKEMPFQTELNTKEAAKRPPQGEHIEL